MANQFLTITSTCAIHPLISADTQLIEVGRRNPIALPFLEWSQIASTLGPVIGRGSTSRIHQINNANPPRVYKKVSMASFLDGNEIRICNIAAEAGVSPAVHGSFISHDGISPCVLIEMDRVGKSLLQHRKDLYKEKPVDVPTQEAESEDDPVLKAERIALEETLKEIEAWVHKFVFRDIPGPKLSFDETIETLYGSQEAYYYQFFSSLQILAKHNIAHIDLHCDNIIPTGNKVMLIDFDLAELTSRVSQAVSRMIKETWKEFARFRFVATTDESRELIRWFCVQASEESRYQPSLKP